MEGRGGEEGLFTLEIAREEGEAEGHQSSWGAPANRQASRQADGQLPTQHASERAWGRDPLPVQPAAGMGGGDVSGVREQEFVRGAEWRVSDVRSLGMRGEQGAAQVGSLSQSVFLMVCLFVSSCFTRPSLSPHCSLTTVSLLASLAHYTRCFERMCHFCFLRL